MFAGVTNFELVSGPANLRLGPGHRARTYPSPIWVAAVSALVLDDPDVLHGLTFTANPLVSRRGDRIEVERPASHHSEPALVTIRSTAAIELILGTCWDGATWHELIAEINTRWPNVPRSTVETTVRTLVRDGFVTTNLMPDNACDDPLGNVLKRFPSHHELVPRLAGLRETLSEADGQAPGTPGRAKALAAARGLCDGVVEIERPRLSDVAVDAHIRLPESLGKEAARVANILWRNTSGTDPLVTWHAEFHERYGANRLVPLTEATDHIAGLGTTIRPTPHNGSEADAVLTDLYVRALASDGIEVDLDDETIAALDLRAADDVPPASAEIYVRVLAANSPDRDAGRFFLAVSGMAQPAGATRGRFTTLLPSTTDRMNEPGPIVAEIAVEPRAHIARSLLNPEPPTPFRIRIGGRSRDGDLQLDELALLSNGHHLILWSTIHERQVIPVHHHHIGHQLMPPLAGLLCRLGQHHTVSPAPWSWGPLASTSFLPRVRSGPTILSPARWRLPASLTSIADSKEWADELDRWRHTTTPAPPSTVVIDDDDRQLPLNLDRDDDRELLRRYARRGTPTVTEPPGGADAVQAIVPGPDGHHVLEVVVPLDGPKPAPVRPPHQAPLRYSGSDRFLPGGPWLSLAITAPPATQDEVITHLATIAAETSEFWDRWFWLRYHTDQAGHHLRVRFHGEPDVLGGTLLPAVHQACSRLVQQRLSGGFTIEPYDQELDRYGGTDTITAAEQVFWRDAELVAHTVNMHSKPDDRLVAAALSATAIARILADSNRRALEPPRLDPAARQRFHIVRQRTRDLDLDARHTTEALWTARSNTLAGYRKVLAVDRRIDCASSLIHMHANRLLGDLDTECIARALAADLIARSTA